MVTSEALILLYHTMWQKASIVLLNVWFVNQFGNSDVQLICSMIVYVILLIHCNCYIAVALCLLTMSSVHYII